MVGLGIIEDTLEFPQVEARGFHHLLEVLQQGGIARFAINVDVVDGLLDGEAKGLLPQTVGDVRRKPGILRAGHPLGKMVAEIGGLGDVDRIGREGAVGLLPSDERRGDGRVRLRVLVFVVLREGQLLFSRVLQTEGVEIGDPTGDVLGNGTVLADRPLDLADDGLVLAIRGPKEGRHLVEITLRPIGQRMVVALGAGHVAAQEGRQQVGHAIQRHLRIIQQETGGAVITQAAVGGQHLPHHHIPRGIGGDARLEPILEAEGRDALVERVLHAQQVGHPVEHLERVAGGVDELVDQLGALVGGTIIQEGGRLGGGRDATDGVDVDASEELLVGGRRIQLLTLGGQRGHDQTIDFGGGLRYAAAAEALFPRLHRAGFREGDVFRAEDIPVEVESLPVLGLQGDEFARESAEHRLDGAALIIRPDAPNGAGRCGQRIDAGGRRGLGHRGGGLLGFLLVDFSRGGPNGRRHQTGDAENQQEDTGKHGGSPRASYS